MFFSQKVAPIPERAGAAFASIVIPGQFTGRLLHHAGYLIQPIGIGNQVDMIAGDVVSQERNLEFENRFAQALAIPVTIHFKSEKECPVVASMNKVIYITREDISIRSFRPRSIE